MKVWLDDIRPIPEDFTHWAKSAKEAIALLQTGLVEAISLDHDLGHSHSDGFAEEQTGYTVAKWIEEHAADGTLKEVIVYIHTQNVVGKANIKMALRNAKLAWARSF